jgi:prevent-host-death family protein
MATVGSYEAKTHLPALLERVQAGESIVITKHGRAVARLVPVTEEPRRPIADILGDLMAGRVPLEPGDDVAAWIADGRR